MNRNGRINNGRMNNRRINTTARTNTGGTSYMLIGIVLLVLIGVAIYFFWSRKLSTSVDPKTFSGLVLGSRIKGKLSDISKIWKSQIDKSPWTPTLFLVDCSNNIVWKTGDSISTSTETKIYTMLTKARFMNTSDIAKEVSTWNTQLTSISNQGSSVSNMELKSIILISKDNIPKNSNSDASLSDEEFVKKVMSYATNEYPINAC